LKILHLISGGDAGGAKTSVLAVVRELQKNNYANTSNVTLATLGGGVLSDSAAVGGIRHIVFPAGLSGIMQLARYIRENGYDILHSHGARANTVSALLTLFVRVKTVTTIHSDPRLDYLNRGAKGFLFDLLNRAALRRIGCRVCVSEELASRMKERGFPKNRVFVYRNGMDFSEPIRHITPDERNTFLRRYGLDFDDDSVIIGCGARLDPIKDQATLLRAFAGALKTAPNLRLVLAGDGSERESLQKLAAELDLSGRYAFTGWLEDMSLFYASLDINIDPAREEYFGYVVVEGSRYALATVATNCGGVQEIIDNGETGLLFAPGDADTLSKHIVKLAGDAAYREKLGRALERSARKFTIADSAAALLQIYKSTLRHGVIISGAYGLGNTGDEAILLAVIREMSEIDPLMPVTVLSRKPRETAALCGADAIHSFNFPKILPLMKKSALFISGGGSLIQDVTSRKSLWYYLFTLYAAKKLGCKTQLYGCGIGPVNFPRDIKLVREILGKYADAITLRDSRSRDELDRFGVTKPTVILSADPGITTRPADTAAVDAVMLENGIEPNGDYLYLTLRTSRGVLPKPEAFAEAAIRLYNTRGLTPLFLPISAGEDGAAADIAADLLKDKIPVRRFSKPLPPELAAGALSRAKAMISMRLHGLVFAAIQGVPAIGVKYTSRANDFHVTAFAERIGAYSLTLDELTAENLIILTEKALGSSRDGSRTAAMRRMLEDERRNQETARRLLSGE